MKIGVILATNEHETAWNAFRFGVTALGAGHNVKIFLTGKGVEASDIKDEKFNVKEQTDKFIAAGGSMLACGTCLKSRNKDGTETCPLSTMKDMLKLIEESDKVLTFG
ncbi:DsrE/DsrF-like family protein [uncultured archaeon]|nr:DsrE/DsrF-like family protein [uncultured archaeon]